MSDGKRYRHESFGQISFSRTSSSMARPLFGSDLTHKNTIVMEVKQCELDRHVNTDWYHGYNKLLEIEMSPVQFSELITNMNSEGVPCTIKYLNGEYTEECPFRDKTDVMRSEFRSTINKVSKASIDLVKKATALLNEKKTFNKTDKEELLSLLSSIQGNLGNNLGYIAECCQEQVDKTVVEAKGEIESYIMNRVNTLGLEDLRQETQHMIGLEQANAFDNDDKTRQDS